MAKKTAKRPTRKKTTTKKAAPKKKAAATRAKTSQTGEEVYDLTPEMVELQKKIKVAVYPEGEEGNQELRHVVETSFFEIGLHIDKPVKGEDHMVSLRRLQGKLTKNYSPPNGWASRPYVIPIAVLQKLLVKSLEVTDRAKKK